ncbi:30S ribosomal protein S19 [Candidatus Woesearchaeota archaeon]|nr:30S ribosomal protein S19 [Candidatus Woesearchaeota archaeon]
MVADFNYHGKSIQELVNMSLKDFASLLPARQRRSLNRGLNDKYKNLLRKLKVSKKPVKTHLRDAVVIPEMVGKIIHVHNGKEYAVVRIEQDMIGHYLGEFALTRKSIKHSAPGIGATKSSAAVSVR